MAAAAAGWVEASLVAAAAGAGGAGLAGWGAGWVAGWAVLAETPGKGEGRDGREQVRGVRQVVSTAM